jgi:outer membrane murein-binding lipoprotein Lpp
MELTYKGRIKKFPLLALVLLALAGCLTDNKAQEERRQEIQGLKTEVAALKKEITALKEQVSKLEAGQQEILGLLKKPAAPPAAAAPPSAAEPLTVSQLLREKERLLGARITVRALPGPVVVHRKTLLLKAPEGAVEVYFGSLADMKTVNRLTSTSLDQPLTITGVLSPPARGGGNLRIIAEVVEF